MLMFEDLCDQRRPADGQSPAPDVALVLHDPAPGLGFSRISKLDSCIMAYYMGEVLYIILAAGDE